MIAMSASGQDPRRTLELRQSGIPSARSARVVTVRMVMGVAPGADMEIPRAALFHGGRGIDDPRPKGFGVLVDCDRGARDHVLGLAYRRKPGGIASIPREASFRRRRGSG